ncbi:hypothetical protein Z043_125965 [Scleropages formosus]|uniref:Uncharacterized protein n=1 Tax=Scleropages formosus TaxID=113540 RepID=A0A0P7U9Q5_SCLFO|nr:hypothetical protein Z043_125965 [Scleropages formosus]
MSAASLPRRRSFFVSPRRVSFEAVFVRFSEDLRSSQQDTMRRFFLASVFALLCGACGARRGQREHGGAWEEDTGVPLRLDPPTAPGEEKEDTRLYQVDAFGTRFVLELRADPSAPPPGLAPQRCLFSGSVNRDPRSAAALHVCDGLRGGFRLGGDDYLIEPRTVGGRSDTHVVRRRRRAHLSVKTCGVREEEEEQRAPGGSPFASASPPGRSWWECHSCPDLFPYDHVFTVYFL